MENGTGKRAAEAAGGDAAPAAAKRGRCDEQSYFGSYEDYELHALMIGDEARTMAYKRAILTNYRRLHRACVADVGCGSGILSLFCALAGARVVYAVEGSAFASVAEKLVVANDAQDKVQVIASRAEEVRLPEKVDAIVSEWMGYGLLYENMLPSVIDFRDRHLKEGGLMFPESARLFVAALGGGEEATPVEESRSFWRRMSGVYKVQLGTALADLHAEDALGRGHVEAVAPPRLVSRECAVAGLDLRTVTRAELECVRGPLRLVCFGDTRLVGLALWFEVAFPGGQLLSTSPAAEPTHWQQVVFYLGRALDVVQDTVVEGELQLRRAGDFHRFLDVRLVATVVARGGEAVASIDQCWKLST